MVGEEASRGLDAGSGRVARLGGACCEGVREGGMRRGLLLSVCVCAALYRVPPPTPTPSPPTSKRC